MCIEDRMNKMVVKVICGKNSGSGFLVQPSTNEYSYVITARHCLKGKEDKDDYLDSDIRILRGNLGINKQEISVRKSYLHEKKSVDIAVIVVDYIADIPNIYFGMPEFEEGCIIYGYPAVMNEVDPNTDKIIADQRDILKGDISKSGKETGIVEVKLQQAQDTRRREANYNVSGFSGAPIFKNIRDGIKVYGVFTELKAQGGALNTYCGYCYSFIEDIINQQEGLASLISYKLTTFDIYLEEGLKKYPDNVQAVIKKKYKQEILISPCRIVDELKEKLVIPYNSEEYLCDQLWIGWSKLIGLLYIADIDLEKFTDIKYTDSINSNRIRFFYSSTDVRVKDMVCRIFTDDDILGYIKDNDIIILNNNDTPNDKFLDKKRIGKIVKNIDSVELFEHGINIAEDNYSRNISAIHIEYFGDELDCKIDEDINIFDVEKEIKKVVLGVLSSVNELR